MILYHYKINIIHLTTLDTMEITKLKHKIIISVAVLFVTLLLHSCSDSATNAPATSDEYFEASINGERWIGDMSIPTPTTPGSPILLPLVLKDYDRNSGMLMLSAPRGQRSTSEFDYLTIFGLTIFGFDNQNPIVRNVVIASLTGRLSRYQTAQDTTNILRITRLDTENKIVEGEFSFRMRNVVGITLDTLNLPFPIGISLPILGDSVITVTDGRFRIKYETGTRWTRP